MQRSIWLVSLNLVVIGCGISLWLSACGDSDEQKPNASGAKPAQKKINLSDLKGEIRFTLSKNPGAAPAKDSSVFYRVRPDGSGLKRLFVQRGAWEASWSSDGEKVAYFTRRDSPEFLAPVLHIVNKDGRHLRRIPIEGASTGVPAWSSDGKFVAVAVQGVREVPGSPDPNAMNADIYGVRVSNGKLIQLTNSQADESMPQYSPDGRELAVIVRPPYGSSTQPNEKSRPISRVGVLSARGGILQLISPPDKDAFDPQWIPPSSRQIIFSAPSSLKASYEAESPKYFLYTLNRTAGKAMASMSKSPKLPADAEAIYSPDGQWIAYTYRGEVRAEGKQPLLIADKSGGKSQKVPGVPVGIEALQWLK